MRVITKFGLIGFAIILSLNCLASDDDEGDPGDDPSSCPSCTTPAPPPDGIPLCSSDPYCSTTTYGGTGSNSSDDANTYGNDPTRQNISLPGSYQNSSNGCSSSGLWTGGDPGNPVTTAPVVLSTGEKIKIEKDVLAGNEFGLPLTRTYKSKNNTGDMFGTGWISTYDYQVLLTYGCFRSQDYPGKCIPTAVLVTMSDGSQYYYQANSQFNNGGFSYSVVGAAAAGTMSYDPDLGWQLKTPIKTYNWSTYGYIQSIYTAGGTLLQQYNYSATTYPARRYPTSVTNAAGQRIGFTYNSSWYVTQVTDPNNQVWTYSYTNVNLLTGVSSPGSNPDVKTYYYEQPSVAYWLLTGIAINGTRFSTYVYGPDKKVQQSSLADGQINDRFTYGTNVTTLTDVRGEVTTYTFIAAQGALKISGTSRASTSTCSAGSATTHYDANGWQSSTVDWNGNTTSYSYDVSGKLLSKTLAYGTGIALTQTNTWTGNNLTRIAYSDANGNVFATRVYTYVLSGFGLGKVLTDTWTDSQSGAQRSLSYAYTFQTNGLPSTFVISRSLPNSQVATTTTTYNTMAAVSSTTDALGHQTTYSGYNGLGLVGHSVDLNGHGTDFSYAANGTLASTAWSVNGGVRVTTNLYDHDRQITDVIYSDGAAKRYRYSVSENLQYMGNGAAEFVQVSHDTIANATTTSSSRAVAAGSPPAPSAAGQFSSITYFDSLGRSYNSQGNNSQLVQYRYDANGNLLTRKDAAGRTTTYVYDALNRITKVTAPDGGNTLYGYDSRGNKATVTDPRSFITSYTYNAFGQVLTQTSPDSGVTTYTYDTAGRLASKILADGVSILYANDMLDRQISRTSAGVVESLYYDQGMDGIGHLTSFVDPTGQTSYSYTGGGELQSQTNTIYGKVYTTTWNINLSGKPTTITYPAGLVLSYAYDTFGRLSAIHGSNLGSPVSVIADTLLYQPATDRLYAWRNGNGVSSIETLDTDGRTVNLHSDGTRDLSYSYSATDLVSGVVDNIQSALSATYTYDGADRLSNISNSADAQSFSWDAVGNRTAQNRNGTSFSYTMAVPNNRLASWSGGGQSRVFSYDASGNLRSETRSDGTRTYSYDAFDRMSGVYVNGSFVGDYRNNALNQRVYRGYNGYGWGYGYGQGGELLFEMGPTPTSYIWVNGMLLGILRAGQIYPSHNDKAGRPYTLTNGTGATAWKATNTPFERTIALDTVGGLNVGLPGQYYDPETGLWNNWNRYYDGSLGRYIQSDPIGLSGGIGTYTYAGGNPLSNIDFQGTQTINFGYAGSTVNGLGVEGGIGGYLNFEDLSYGSYVYTGSGAGINNSAGFVFGYTRANYSLDGSTFNVNGSVSELLGGTVSVDEKGDIVGYAWTPGLATTPMTFSTTVGTTTLTPAGRSLLKVIIDGIFNLGYGGAVCR